MSGDLFASGSSRAVRLPLSDADVLYLEDVALGNSPSEILRQLIDETPWKNESVVIWGKRHLQPRLSAWYGDVGARYSYSGITLEPLMWTGLLHNLKGRVEEIAATAFNGVLANYYRNGRDSMGFHSDDEPELGKRPTIASLSLGEERTFVFRRKGRKDVRPVRLRLGTGSLLLMSGDTQRFWQHGIAKEARPCGPRVNLTFRRIDR